MAASCPTRVAARTARRQELRGNGTKKPVETQKVVVVVVVAVVGGDGGDGGDGGGGAYTVMGRKDDRVRHTDRRTRGGEAAQLLGGHISCRYDEPNRDVDSAVFEGG